MKRFFLSLALGVCVCSFAVQEIQAASTPVRAIYAAPKDLSKTIAPGQSQIVTIRIDRKNLRSAWVRVATFPTSGIVIKGLPTWTRANELRFTAQVLKTAKLGEAKINLTLSQSGLIARLPMAFTIGSPVVSAAEPVKPVQQTGISTCRVYPQDNPWNLDISKALTHWNSDAYIASIGATRGLHPDFGENQEYGIPVTIASTSTPDVSIRFTDYGDESDPGPYPIPATARVEAGGDAHVIVYSPSRCKLYELYAAKKEGNTWTAASGAIFDLTSNALRPAGWTSADAAGLPIYPGLVKYDEVASGKITHAIRFTAPRTQNGYIHPATHYAGVVNENLPPMGLRLRLKASTDISTLTGQAKVIAEAMKTYGLILADNGSSWFFQGETDPRWKDEELNQLKNIPGSAFEAVETGAILK